MALILRVCLILKAVLGPGVYSASNRNKYEKQNKQKKKVLVSRALPVREADNLTAICEPIV
jgi:hypothetical protein